SLEETEGLRRNFEPPKRFRLHAQVEIQSCLPGQLRHVLHASPEILANPHLVRPRFDEGFERTRQRAHARLAIRRIKLHQQIEQSLRVIESLGAAPVRLKNPFLNSRPVKTPERK